jgi:hypothetical protein
VDIDKLLLILVPALSGLTFLAYKHPKAYDTLWLVLNIILIVVFVGANICDESNTYAYTAVIPYITSGKFAEVNKAVSDQKLLSGAIYLLAIVLACYLLFLHFLPSLLGEDKPGKEKIDNE